MKSSADQKIEDAFNYAINFYNTHPRTLENQWVCLAEMQKITGLDDDACAKIQSPILSVLMYQETVDIANEAIQNQLRIVTDLLRNRLLDLQPKMQPDVMQELPYIPKVPSKPIVVNSLDEAVKEQIPSDGVYQLVNFSNKDLGYKGVEQLLYSDKGVKAIRDGSSNLSDIYQGMAAKQGVMIVQLNLSNCNIGGLGADKLGQAIHNDSGLHSLQYLNLSNNSIDDSGIYSLASNAKGNSTPSLRWLDLSNNWLTDNGVNSFHWAFKENKLYNLNYLNVSGNKITDTGAKTIAEGLKSGTFSTLKRFDASGNDISLVGEKFMLDALKHESTQDIIILLKKSTDLKNQFKMFFGNKEQKVQALCTKLKEVEAMGIDTKQVAVSKSLSDKIFGQLKGVGISAWGASKCHLIPDSVKSFAQDIIVGKVSKKLEIAHNTNSLITCYLEHENDRLATDSGIELIKQELVDLVGTADVCDAM